MNNSNYVFKRPEELYSFLISNTTYRPHVKHLKTVEEIYKEKTLDCWEAVEFQKQYLINMKDVTNVKSFFMGFFTKNESNYVPYSTHTVSLFMFKNKITYLEASWKDKKGIYTFNTWNDAIRFILKEYARFVGKENIKKNNIKKLFLVEYFDIPLHATDRQFFDAVFEGKILFEKEF